MAKNKSTEIQNNNSGLHGQYRNWFLDYASYVILERAKKYCYSEEKY